MLNDSTIWQIYQALSDDKKQIVKIASIIYEPISDTLLTDICRKLDISLNAEAAKNLTHAGMFKAAIQSLVRLNVLQSKLSFNMVCNEEIVEWVFREAIKEPYFERLVHIIDDKLKLETWYYYGTSFDRAIRDLRLGFLRGESTRIYNANKVLQDRFARDMYNFNFNARFFGYPPDMEWFSRFAPQFQLPVLFEQARYTLKNLEDPLPFFDAINTPYYTQNANEDLRDLPSECNAMLYTLQGNHQGISDIVNSQNTNTSKGIGLAGITDFLQGHYEAALEKLERYVKAFRKEQGRRKVFPDTWAGFAYIMSMIIHYKSDIPTSVAADIEMASYPIITVLRSFILLQQNDVKNAILFVEKTLEMSLGKSDQIIPYICYYWTGSEQIKIYTESIKKIYVQAGKNGYKWIEMEAAALLSHIAEKPDLYRARWRFLEEETGCKSILPAIERQEEWLRALQALGSLAKNEIIFDDSKQNLRVIWFVDFDRKQISAIEQSLTKSGKWSSGRNIALKRIFAKDIPAMTPHDWKICQALANVGSSYYNNYEWDFSAAVEQMVGHPLLFIVGTPPTPITLEKGELELLINEVAGGYEIKFNLPVGATEQTVIVKETATRYKIIKIGKRHLEIARALGGKPLTIPDKGRETLGKVSKQLSSLINIHSPLIHDDDDIEIRQPDERMHLLLMPFGEGLRVEMYVKPLSDTPPYSKPGEGSASLLLKVDNKPIQTLRNLNHEKVNMGEVISYCPVLAKNDKKDAEWILDEVEESLQLLVELEPLIAQNKVVVEWPKGERFRIKYQLGMGNMSLRAKKQSDWFSLEGEVRLDEHTIMQMREFLDLAENSASRFISLNDGSYIALTKEFRRRLQELNAYLENTRSGTGRIHNLAAYALDDFTKSIGHFEADIHWKNHLKKLKNTQKHDPQVPSTLQADLRNYQVEGFKWLSQMAYWGVGACLADDMGLGKTLQALAVILERAYQGPTLIVAPASVCQNWINEAARFAPTLNPLLFGKTDRQAMVDALKPFDMLVCSYTLMQQEGEMLSKIQWATSVLDEAQAIKNQNTKRSKAAMDLNSNFRIITTGTPIENHLGELWNLFNFINPNMLGSLQSFNERFAIPIERNDDKGRRRQLQRLIQPFILRRRKNQVLEELPSKTEIALSVELSREELAFYEAIRQNAIQKLENMKDTNEGAQRIQILAEIMRLRQAACNPELVSPDIAISSSKLQLFAEVVSELLENGHKALVFSQFVGHLRIIERKVQEMGIKYQYLDGQTPVPSRQKLVDDFQRGQGDLFLISLKAGGVGLNLTAADYVIIMDPWWNPAVEDQAADRAHRIGQQRPVTIYRLITQNTIEEKIVQLHAQKRDLADSLLEGTEGSGKLTADELFRLIKEI